MAGGSEKRKFPRGPLMLPVTYTLKEETTKGYITDLSPGGCRVYGYSPVEIQRKGSVEISLKLKNWEKEVLIEARIVRVNPFVYNPDFGSKEKINFEFGVKFLKTTKDQREAIEAFIRRVLRRMKKEKPEPG